MKFHPSCHKLHKVYNADKEIVNCPGRFEIFTIKDSSGGETSAGMTEDTQQGGSSMEKKLDWLVDKINLIEHIVKEETANLRQEIEEMKKMLDFKKTTTKEMQKIVNASGERGEIKKSYSEVMKGSPTESVLVIKPKDKEENKSSEDTKKDVKKIDVSKLGVGITKMKKVRGGTIVVGCENKAQADKLKDEVVKDLGQKYDVQAPKKRKPKVKIFNIDNEDCEDERIFWEKVEEQNGIQKNTIDGKIIRKVTKANFKKTVVIAEVNIATREKLLQMEKLKIGWNICKVIDYIGIIRCYKCCGFYHFAKDCTKKEVCGNCADQHATKDCKSNLMKCVNCEDKAKNFKIKNLKSDHSAYDSSCPCLKKEIEKQQEKIQYEDI
ncbi:uncharacterized protein [Polyergus mexicanus]|uniref:uncharacterized protein n=1 Tax=Polyergus mexicanus TaxID=615972 RepID=UPI0038B4D580